MFEWFSSDLKTLFEENFKEESIKKHNLLNYDYIQKEYNKLKKDGIVNINKLWFILVFQLWYKRYMDK